MKQQRIITGVVLAIVATGLLLVPPLWFAAVTLGLLGLAGWEWSRCASQEKFWQRLSYAIAIVMVAVILASFADDGSLVQSLVTAKFLGFTQLQIGGLVVLWLGVFIAIPCYPKGSQYWFSSAVRLLLGVCLLPGAWLVLVWLRGHDYGQWLLALLLATVVVTDTMAWYAGRHWGKRRLIPQVSPKKTWLGLTCGLLAGSGVGLVALPLWGISGLLACMCVAIASVGGDLTVSMAKRMSGQDDSGALLPGHGGILDRIDGLIAAAPFYGLFVFIFLPHLRG